MTWLRALVAMFKVEPTYYEPQFPTREPRPKLCMDSTGSPSQLLRAFLKREQA